MERPETKLPSSLIPIPDGDLSFNLYHSTNDFPLSWDLNVPQNRLYLHSAYLSSLEKYPPEGMQFCYLLFYKAGEVCGMASLQILDFQEGGSTPFQEEVHPAEACKCFFHKVRNFINRKIDYKTLICGNLLLTGEYGSYFNPSMVSAEEGSVTLDTAMKLTKNHLSERGTDITLYLIKEYFASSKPQFEPFRKLDFHEFTIEPNMVLSIRAEWKNFEDYLAAMTSKYRVRAKRAFKKGKNLERKELNLEEIALAKDRIHELYLGVAESVGFNAVALHPNYFYGLKESLGDKFKMFAYYLDGKLVTFYTTLHNDKDIDAHFLGYDKELNHNHQLYLNALYDLIKIAIASESNQLIFARTALEIKSSVGAVAYDMYCYLRHKNGISNLLLKPFLQRLNPELEWTPRHPFKETLA